MSTDTALAPPDPDVYAQILADRVRDYNAQGKLLRITFTGFIAAVVATIIVALGATWAITKERDHPYVMAENPVTGARFLIAPAGPVTSPAGRQSAVDEYIRQAFEITEDATYNINRRKAAIRKMRATKPERDQYLAAAITDLEKNKGFVHTVDTLVFYPPSVPDPSGLHMDVELTLKIQDMRADGSVRDAVRFESYRVPIIMHEIDPWPGNLAGLAFVPAKTIRIKEKTR